MIWFSESLNFLGHPRREEPDPEEQLLRQRCMEAGKWGRLLDDDLEGDDGDLTEIMCERTSVDHG